MIKRAESLECRNFNTFIRTERDALQRAIDEDKWYLSERAGYDVGWEKAKQHFYKKFLLGFSKQYRRTFCEQLCEVRSSCLLYKAHREKAGDSLTYTPL